MAKNKPQSKTEKPMTNPVPTNSSIHDDSPPDEFQSFNDDLVGFWDMDAGSIFCTLVGAKLFDSSIDKTKPSVLVLAELIRPCLLTPSKSAESDEPIQGQPGDLVGIWAKAGMKAIKNLYGVKVWIKKTGTKDVGKINPMTIFDVRGERIGKPLPILDDTRHFSRNATTFLTQGRDLARKQSESSDPLSSDDDIPF